MLSTFDVLTKPNQTKTSPSQQFYFLEPIWKTITKSVFLFLSESKTFRKRRFALILQSWERVARLIINFFFDSFDCLLLLFVLPANIFTGADFDLIFFKVDTGIFILAGLSFAFRGGFFKFGLQFGSIFVIGRLVFPIFVVHIFK